MFDSCCYHIFFCIFITFLKKAIKQSQKYVLCNNMIIHKTIHYYGGAKQQARKGKRFVQSLHVSLGTLVTNSRIDMKKMATKFFVLQNTP